ncbi:MAG: hypothetical protein GWP27_04600 [Bacteroidetes bacterium]|nr:hypothetical protein [Bacteroidota bacterium]
MNRAIILFVLVTFFGHNSTGQKSIEDSTISVVALGAQIGLSYPLGELGLRFGYSGMTGGSLMFKTKSKWIIEPNMAILFGNQVKEDSILDPITTNTNIIIDRTGNPANVVFFERGFITSVRVGKIWSMIGPNPNCGIQTTLGVGYMQHRIRIQDESESIPQLQGNYRKGYDRFTSGLSLMQGVGYQHFSNYRFINYYIGLEIHEGFTKNRRAINFDTMESDNKLRLDVLVNLTLRWYFPMYKRQPKDFYFY